MAGNVAAIVVAAGKSSRMKGINKLEIDLGGKTVLHQSLDKMMNNKYITEIVLVLPESEVSAEKEREFSFVDKPLKIVSGGETRFDSVQNGVLAVSDNVRYIAIHDAARPFVSDELISKTIESAFVYSAAVPALPINETVKMTEQGFIVSTPDRNKLVSVGTPQVFELSLYREAAMNLKDAFDDSEVVEGMGVKVYPVEGERDNIKITHPEDIHRFIYDEQIKIRVGIGYDVHRTAKGRKLIIGGVDIENDFGLAGHSDADVLTHAVIDAVLGAAGMGDIGDMFPDSDERYKDINSMLLLEKAVSAIKEEGFAVKNLDCTVICEKPKIRDFKREIEKNLADCLEIKASDVNVKGTTEEGMGFTGRGEGICANAIVLLYKK